MEEQDHLPPMPSPPQAQFSFQPPNADVLGLMAALQQSAPQSTPPSAPAAPEAPKHKLPSEFHRHPHRQPQPQSQQSPFLLYEAIGVLLSIVNRCSALLSGRRLDKTMYHLTTALRTTLATTGAVYEPALFQMPPCEFISQRGPRWPRIDRELGYRVALAPSVRNVEQAAAACIDMQLVQVENMIHEQRRLGTFRSSECERWLAGTLESIAGARRVIFGSDDEDEAVGVRNKVRLYVNFGDLGRSLDSSEIARCLSQVLEPLNVSRPPTANNYAFATYYAEDAEQMLRARIPGFVIRLAKQ